MYNEIKTWQERGNWPEYFNPAYDGMPAWEAAKAEIAELRARIESLAADAERLNFVIECSNFNKSFNYINVEFNVDSTDGDLRKAIDIAKEKAK